MLSTSAICWAQLRNIDLLPIPVVLTAPANEAQLDSVFPEFDWHHAPMVGVPSHYRLLVSLNTDMSNPELDVLIRYPQAYYQVQESEPLLSNTRYYWMVISENNFGQSRNNITRRFTTGEYIEPVYFEEIEDLQPEPTTRETHTIAESSKVRVYFDISTGFNNYVSHKYDSIQLKKEEGYDGSDFGYEFGCKLGFTLGDLPAYLSLEFNFADRKITNKFDLSDIPGLPNDGKNEIVSNYTQYYIAPGLIYYPMRHLHLAGSFGFSFGKFRLRSDMLGEKTDDTFDIQTGIAYKLSVGYDIFRGSHSTIVGVSVFNTNNDIIITNDITRDLTTTTVAMFLKYRFRSR
jgi:hypothetical protein